MLSVLLLGTAGAHDRSAPPSSLSRSRVLQNQQQSTRGDAIATVQCLRGGGGDKCDVILVGCGVPKRGMGWYHAKQMLDGDVPSATLTTVVEPWFLGQGKDSPPGQTFGVWAEEMSKAHGTKFCASLDEVSINGPTMALISGRTADNPRLLKEVIDLGCTAVYLEKPGAPTVKELEEMRAYANSKGVPVFMGYNKNVTPYVRKALEEAKKRPGSTTTYIHNNAYTEAELPECFERNAEGLLKNMAIHELALLATYWGVTVDTIESVTPDADFSRCLTLKGPSGETFTDFSKAGFTIATTEGQQITLLIDRCGSDAGGNSVAIVSQDGGEVFRSETPDEELIQTVEAAAKADPDMMPYFFLQSDDYQVLKELTTSHVLQGKPGAPEGIATLDVAIDALKLAEYLTPTLQEALAVAK
mmetsp:Transcript_50570/g.168890  ORF Transcript_50570/g.168890 Transcript_50570/m.168890 type:complete len:415 (-) Transcript_50570:100-1344(-)